MSGGALLFWVFCRSREEEKIKKQQGENAGKGGKRRTTMKLEIFLDFCEQVIFSVPTKNVFFPYSLVNEESGNLVNPRSPSEPVLLK